MQILLMEGLTLRLDENTTTPTEGGRGGGRHNYSVHHISLHSHN
jgi:hypothetical protein